MNSKIYNSILLSLLSSNTLFAQEIDFKADDFSKYKPLQISVIDSSQGIVFKTTTSQQYLDLETTHIALPAQIIIVTAHNTIIKDSIYHQNEKKIITLNTALDELDPVVVTGQFVGTTIQKSVHTIRVINQEQIQAMQAQNLKDVLTNELNIRLQQDNILGSSMQMQGLTGQNIKILIDGVPVIGRLDGNIDLSQINLSNIDRIEIIEGPMAVHYGTDALGGTINLISKTLTSKHRLIKWNNYYESIGTYNTDISFQKKINETLSTHINVGRFFFDGWSAEDQPFEYISEHYADSSRFHQWKPKEQYFGNLGLDYNTTKLKLTFKSNYFHEQITNKGLPRLPLMQIGIDDYYITNRWVNNLNANYIINKNTTLNVLAAYSNYGRLKNTYVKNLENLEQVLSSNPQDQDTTLYQQWMSRGNFYYKLTQYSKLKFEMGYEVTAEQMQGAKIANYEKNLVDIAGFSTINYSPINNLVVQPGIRYGYNNIYTMPWIPSLHIKYKLPLKSEQTSIIIRGSYAKGFRAPGLKELYYEFVDINHNIRGNELLEAEYSNNYNLNISYQKKIKESLLSFQWKGFYNQVSNLIQLATIDNAATLYTYTNIGYFESLGSNIIAEWIQQNWKSSIGLGLLGLYNIDAGTHSDIHRFNYTPEIKSNLTYKLLKWKIDCSAFYKYTGATNAFSLNTANEIEQRTIQDYHILDIDIRKSMLKGILLLSVGCKNVLNVTNIYSNMNTGSAHSTNSTAVPLATGRNYCMKVSINI